MNRFNQKRKYYFSITYSKGCYILTNLVSKNVITKSVGFYSLCEYILNNGIILDTVCLPRMSLRRFFRDFAYFEEFERKCSRL